MWQAVWHAAMALGYCIAASRGLEVSVVVKHLTNNEIDDNCQPAQWEPAQLQCRATWTMSQAACGKMSVQVMPPAI